MDERLQVAIQAAILASKYCEIIRGSHNVNIFKKEDGSPVTIADIGSQLIISNMVRSAFPQDLIVGEEDASGLESINLSLFGEFSKEHQIDFKYGLHDLLSRPNTCDSSRFWTVDPVDGTKGFLRGEFGQYAVCIAYIDENDSPLISVIAAPRLDEHGIIMYAVRGQGAFLSELNEIKWRKQVIINRESQVLCCSFESEHSREGVLEKISQELDLTLLKVDSQVKYVMVATGTADLYLRVPPTDYREKIWDHAPGYLLVTEAGGCVMDQDGNDVRFPMTGFIDCSTKSIIVGNSRHLCLEARKYLQGAKCE